MGHVGRLGYSTRGELIHLIYTLQFMGLSRGLLASLIGLLVPRASTCGALRHTFTMTFTMTLVICHCQHMTCG